MNLDPETVKTLIGIGAALGVILVAWFLLRMES